MIYGRERIPGLYSREIEGQTTMLFSLKVACKKSWTTMLSFESGMQKVLPSEGECRDLELCRRDINLEVSQVLRVNASNNLTADRMYI